MSNPFDNSAIAAGYEVWYETTGRRADRLEKTLLKELLAGFPKAETILDVGCGTGHFTRWFERQGLRATGLEISQTMLAEARRHRSDKVLRGDAHLLPLPIQSFDVVAFITTLEFLQKPIVALKEAQRVAQQGFILGVINRIGWIGRQYRRQGGVPWEAAHFFTPNELVNMVKQTCDQDCTIYWQTTLWRWLPWSLPLPWGGFIGMRVRKD
jgi:ubiquinone/menaquinone biosynthesis C-methylase UbiE